MDKSDHVVVFGPFASRNLGDRAIGEVLLDYLARNGYRYACYSTNRPYPGAQEAGIRCIRPRNLISRFIEIFMQLGQADAYLSKWVFQDFGRAKYLPGEIIIPALLAGMAFVRGVPVVYLGSAVGPVDTTMGRLLSRLCLRRADLVVLRDAQSKDYAEAVLGLDVSDWQVAADLALAGHSDQSEPTCQSPHAQSERHTGLFINLAPAYELGYLESKDLDTADRIYKSVSRFLASESSIADLGTTFLATVPEDRIAYEGLRRSSQFLWDLMYEEPRSPQALCKTLAGSSYGILSRYHAIIFAIMTEVPFVGIRYHRKVAALLHRIGWEAYAIDPSDISLTALKECWQALMRDDESARQSLRSARHRLIESSALNFSRFESFMKAHG